MTPSDNDKYITAESASQQLAVSERTIYRYGETGAIRTRKSGRRTMFHAGDVARIAEDLETQRKGPAPDELARLQNDLQQATYRIGYLEAQLGQRLLPDLESKLRDDLAVTKAERDELRRQLQAAKAPWRSWALIVLLLAVAILATLLVSIFVLGAR